MKNQKIRSMKVHEQSGYNYKATPTIILKGQWLVLKGSLLSENISQAKTFRGAKSIIKFRDGVVGEDNRLVVDVTFKSSSTAGNFVTGRSTDGPGSWKTLDGKRLKDML